MPEAKRKTRLSDAEIARFHDEGLVIPDYRVPDDLLKRMQRRGRRPGRAPSGRAARDALGRAQPVGPVGEDRRQLGLARVLPLRRDRRHGRAADRARHHPLGQPAVLQAGGPRHGGALAPGRAVLADRSARHGDGAHRHRGFAAGKRLHALHPGIAQEPRRRRARDRRGRRTWRSGSRSPRSTRAWRRTTCCTPARSRSTTCTWCTARARTARRSAARTTPSATCRRPRATCAMPSHPANAYAAEKSQMMNYTQRPLWLLRGADRAGNDFKTGHGRRAA